MANPLASAPPGGCVRWRHVEGAGGAWPACGASRIPRPSVGRGRCDGVSRRRLLRGLGGAAGFTLLAGAATGCGEAGTPPQRLLIATGNPGGVYHALGEALVAAAARSWGAQTENVATAASVENVNLLVAGEVDAAIVVADVAAAAIEGQAPFPEPVPLAALSRLHDDYVQLVVRAESSIEELADLRGARVSTASPASGVELLAQRILDAGGLDLDRDIERLRLGLNDAADGLRRDELDAFFFSGGLPTPAIAELAERVPIRLIPLDGFVEPLLSTWGELYTERSVPATTYDLPGQVGTIGVGNLLVVRADLPHDTAYAITKLLFDAKPALVEAHSEAYRINRQVGVATFPVSLHPGAADNFRASKQF